MAKKGVGIKELVLSLRRKYLQCQRVPKLLRRPMEMTYYAEFPNQILHPDYLAVNEHGYILTILDNFSGKVYLHFAQGPTADEGVKGLVHWRAHFSLRTKFFW